MIASKLLAFALVGVMSFSILGCESDNDDDDRGADPGDVIISDGDRDDRVEGVPGSAVKVEQGSPADLDYRATDDGTLYLYDADSNRLIYSGDIQRGEQFRADAKHDVATIDGRTVVDRKLKADHNYRLYFDRD